jgi:hypothetical protein
VAKIRQNPVPEWTFVPPLRVSNPKRRVQAVLTQRRAAKIAAVNATRNVLLAMFASAISAFLPTAKSTRIAPMA